MHRERETKKVRRKTSERHQNIVSDCAIARKPYAAVSLCACAWSVGGENIDTWCVCVGCEVWMQWKTREKPFRYSYHCIECEWESDKTTAKKASREWKHAMDVLVVVVSCKGESDAPRNVSSRRTISFRFFMSHSVACAISTIFFS